MEDLNYENYKKISKWIGSDFYLLYKLINYSYEKNKKIIKKLFNSFKSKINKNFYDINLKLIISLKNSSKLFKSFSGTSVYPLLFFGK